MENMFLQRAIYESADSILQSQRHQILYENTEISDQDKSISTMALMEAVHAVRDEVLVLAESLKVDIGQGIAHVIYEESLADAYQEFAGNAQNTMERVNGAVNGAAAGAGYNGMEGAVQGAQAGFQNGNPSMAPVDAYQAGKDLNTAEKVAGGAALVGAGALAAQHAMSGGAATPRLGTPAQKPALKAPVRLLPKAR